MGLLDSIAGQVLGGGSAQQGGLMQAIIALLGNPQTGGLPGLLNSLERMGLGNAVSSWIGTGQNLPISGEQLSSSIGIEQIEAIARQLGLTPQETSGQLAQALPQVVDHLTPQGTMPAEVSTGGGLGDLGSIVGNALRGL